jgi:hypothetical protein
MHFLLKFYLLVMENNMTVSIMVDEKERILF